MSLSQQIKDVLVSLAVQDKLPQDFTELDPAVFDQVLQHAVVPGELKDRYVSLEVDIPGFLKGTPAPKKIQIQVKLDDEGVVVDAFLEGNPDPIASTWSTYQMMKDGEE